MLLNITALLNLLRVFACGFSTKKKLRLFFSIVTVLVEMLLIGRLCASNSHPLNHFPSALLFSGWIIGFITIVLVFVWESRWTSTTAAFASAFCYTLFYFSMFFPGRHTTTINYGDPILGIQIGLTMLAIVSTFSLSIGCISYLGIDHRLKKHASLPKGPSLIRIDQLNQLFLTVTSLSLLILILVGLRKYVGTSNQRIIGPSALFSHILSTIVCVGFVLQLIRRYWGQVKLRRWVVLNLWLTVGVMVIVIYYVSRWGNAINV